MLEVQGILIDRSIFEEYFICDVLSCKGQCCTGGNAGAPISLDEKNYYAANAPKIMEFLGEGQRKLYRRKRNRFQYQNRRGIFLNYLKNGDCIFATKDEQGILKCGLQEEGFKKPISCFLYPLRLRELEHDGLTRPYLTYHKWKICKCGYEKGNAEKVSLMEFCKTAIIQKFDQVFYDELMILKNQNSAL